MIPADVTSQVIEWLVRLLTSLIAGVVGALIAYRWRRGDEKRDSHLAELRTEVFGPMLEYLDQYVLPILRHDAGNVDVCSRRVPATGGLAQRPDFEQYIAVRMVIEPLQEQTFGMGVVPELPLPPGGPFVDDARRHHFADLFHTWDAMIVRFHGYNEACLRYVEGLRAQIVEKNEDLPEFVLQSTALGPEWVNAAALAVIIYLRQIGLSLHELTFSQQRDPRIWTYGVGQMVAQATPMKMVKLEASVNNLLDERSRVQELLAMAQPMAADAARLRATIDEQRRKRTLPGKCPFL